MITLIEELTLEETIERNVTLFREINPTIRLDSDSDYYMPLIQSWSEAEVRLRVETNHNFNQFIWMNAVGSGLDSVALMFGITRLEGSKPYASFTFLVPFPRDIDIVVPELLLGGVGTTARVESFILPAYSRNIEVLGFLNSYVDAEEIKTEELLTTLPYLADLVQLTSYQSGAAQESDDALRERIKLSFAEFSTTGPIKAYVKKTLEADSRIKDVFVWEEDYGVKVTVYASEFDEVLVDRVETALNVESERPLTDQIEVQEATEIEVIINAEMTLKMNTVQSDVQALIENKLEKTVFRIGQSLSRSKVIDMLFVEGVEDVKLNAPALSIDTPLTSVIEMVGLELSYV